ncbi:PucR family transcriptional regulator [Leucobacter triazinivorans]|uniref:PucR family transcriptional regulator n=1 Tax=Leucobacter triazinivorans TaxID=1784719 RepID=A0A4P6KE45_9MICO|nr:helix-turn-helix domain-containing protein [Leucobacter triazinivorans]QBE48178.1 PucR family transcriptional regulator [Leucobacter triazinivorans]
MSLDLAAIARAVGGTCISHRLSERTPVDGVSRLHDFVVIGNPAYATLVTGDPEALLEALGAGASGGPVAAAAPGSSGRGSPRDARRTDRAHGDPELTGAVYVGPSDEPELREALARHGMTAILGTRLGGTALHATLTTLIADDRAAADRLVTAGMNVLTQVARRGGATAVIAELAHRIDGWAVLLDAQGQLVASAGAGRLHISDAAALALGRPVRVRHDGLQLHQVGSDRDLAGYLVIATRSSRTSHSRDLASLAAALFDLLLRTHNPSLTEHLGREALLATLLAGGSGARELLRRWGVHEPSLTGFELGAKTRTIDLERLLRRWCDELGAEHVFAEAHDRVRGFVRDDLAAELAARVEAFAPVAGRSVHLGLGAPAPVETLSRSAVQARQALGTALDDGQQVVSYAALPTVDLVLSTLGDASGKELATVLDPLRDPSGAHGDLTRTLRVYLSEHGAHRASSARLGIHRQTLVSRIRRVEDLTGLSLDRADDRAAAWLALRAAGF